MPNSESQAGTTFTARQCARKKIELPFQVGGLDASGCFFEESVVTRDFSEGGGSFSSTYPLEVGSTLKLADSSGFVILIRIAWRRKNRENSENYGFAFINPLEERLENEH
jgi:PilZ domain-containing protein